MRPMTDVPRTRTGRSVHPPRLLERVAEAAEGVLAELKASAVTVSQFLVERQEWVTVANVGRLGLGEDRFPVDERYSRNQFPQVTALLAQGHGYVAIQWSSDCLPEVARTLAMFGRSSCVGVPLAGPDGKFWGELYATRSYGRPPFGPSELALATRLSIEVAGRLWSDAERILSPAPTTQP